MLRPLILPKVDREALKSINGRTRQKRLVVNALSTTSVSQLEAKVLLVPSPWPALIPLHLEKLHAASEAEITLLVYERHSYLNERRALNQ